MSSDDDELGLISRPTVSYDLTDGCRNIGNMNGEMKCAGETPGVDIVETDEGTIPHVRELGGDWTIYQARPLLLFHEHVHVSRFGSKVNENSVSLSDTHTPVM